MQPCITGVQKGCRHVGGKVQGNGANALVAGARLLSRQVAGIVLGRSAYGG